MCNFRHLLTRHSIYTQWHWAKSDRAEPGRIHLLEHHLADVGACFEALLEQPTIRKRLAHTKVQRIFAQTPTCPYRAEEIDYGTTRCLIMTQFFRSNDAERQLICKALYLAREARKGLSSATDGQRYIFTPLGWSNGKVGPQAGMRVNFEPRGSQAVEIYPIEGVTPAPTPPTPGVPPPTRSGPTPPTPGVPPLPGPAQGYPQPPFTPPPTPQVSFRVNDERGRA